LSTLAIASAEQISTHARAQAPVFIVGSARSGNTLLYHTLLSSGGFAEYRGEPAVFDLFAPKFGSLASRRNRERLMTAWLHSKMYRISGLEQNSIRDKILNHCHSRGDFLRILMGEIARSQGRNRWAVWGPDNLLWMNAIKAEIPEALFLHVIRDGRDVAMSMHREGWIAPFPWDCNQALLAAALHWKWKIARGIQSGRSLGPDYLEVRFEDLVANPQNTLAQISRFIAQDLDASQIRQHSIGTLGVPNSTFQEEVHAQNFQPVERWRHAMSAADLKSVESSIGPLLQRLGYALTTGEIAQPSAQQRLAQLLYPRYFDFKEWLKLHTVLGRLTSVERLHLTQ
jgi:Sulfotransferase family